MKLIRRWQRLVTTIVTIALVAGISNILPPEFKNVPKAQAAQVAINGDYYNFYAEQNASPQVAFTTNLIGYAFYIDETGDDVRYKKTTDGGATWAGETDLSEDLNWGTVAVWYDQWTPGDITGTKIYIVGSEASTDDLWFKILDTNGDTLSPTGTTWTSVAAGTGWSYGSDTGASVTKNTDGNLFATCSGTGDLDVYKSTNAGASWSATTSGLDATTDFNQVLPVGLTGGDVLLLNHDTSANQLRSNVYDEATDAWSGFTNRIAATENNTYDGSFGAALNKLTGDVYVVINNNPATSDGDLNTARATSDGTTFGWNNTTDAYTNIGTAGLQGTMAIDWHNGDVYCFYLRGTAGSAMNVYYKKSSDQAATWGSESAAVSSATGDYTQVYANMTSPYKIHVSWVDTTNADMLAVNYTDTTALDIADARMMLFYDGASVPATWSSLSASAGDIFYQKFPRGFSSYGNPAGADTHDHTATVSNMSFADASAMVSDAGTDFSPQRHTHTLNADSDSVSILPTYRELQIIQYDAGIPSGATAIPANAIAIFDTASMPSGWAQLAAQDDQFIRGGPDGEATGGGSGLHNHTVSFLGPDPSIGTNVGTIGGGGMQASLPLHNHAVENYNSEAGDFLPLNIDIVLGQNGGSAGPIPGGMLAMFTAAPGGSWAAKSGDDVAGVFNQKFFEAKSSYAASGGGAVTHTHASAIGLAALPPEGAADFTDGTEKVEGTDISHSHTFDLDFNTANNLPTYVDVMVYKYPAYTPDSRNWRVYDDENQADPDNTTGTDITAGDAIMAEETDTSPAGHSTRIVYVGNAVKVRVVVGETAGSGGTDVKYKLQYDTNPAFPSAVSVEAQGGSTVYWRYYDGANVADDDVISTVRLSGNSPSAGRHNEDASIGVGEGSTFDPAASTNYEHEFTIQLNPDVTKPSDGTTFYFRLQYTEDSRRAGGSWTTVAKNASNSYPQLTTAAAADLEASTAPTDVEMGTYNKGGGGTLTYDFVASEEMAFWDKRGTATAYDATISSMSMAKSGGGDTIPGTDITWTSATIDLTGAFASDKTGMATSSPCTLDSSCDAYIASPGTEGKGGFFYLPTVALANLESRLSGDYSGDLIVTIL
ncbi:MAG: hypothetical protein V1826_03215 [bacterium]